MKDTPNLIVELSMEFSLEIIKFTERLERDRKFNLLNQCFRAGRLIGAKINEAQSCESRADFIHKMKVAAKKAEETKCWLTLCEKAESYQNLGLLLEKLQIIIKVLNKIIVSSKQVKAQ